MNVNPLTSIVIITYNNADTIEECLLSLLKQNYTPIEIIVVYDEGSTDGTKDVIEKILSIHVNAFKILPIQHVGRSRARNIGWRNSKGDVIFFADADDTYYEDYLTKAISQIVKDDNIGGVCLTGASLTKGDSFISGCMDVYSKIQQSIVDSGNFKPSWAWIYKRTALEKVNGYDEELDQAEDKDLFIRVTRLGYKIGLVTGRNWLHRRTTKLSSHIKKSYLGGKRRVLFIAKHLKWKELFFEILPFWFLILLLTLSLVNAILLIPILFGFISFFIIRTIKTVKIVWNKIEKKRFVFLYPIFNIVIYLFSAAGTTYGLLYFLLNKDKRGSGLWH